MKTLKQLAMAAAAVSALAVSSQAVTLTVITNPDPAPLGTPITAGNVNDAQDIIDDYGFDPGDVLYKSDDPSGLLVTKFSDDGENDATIVISWDGSVPRPTLTYLALKAANEYVLYSITDWNGEDIEVENTYIVNQRGNAQGISHIMIFGKDDGGGGGGGVPDAGSTALLLGLGTLAMAGARKFRK